MDKKIKVMIADDQVILAEGIKSVLETDPELEVIGLAFDGFDALEKMEKNPPDVVLMDIRMPNMNGVVATQSIKAEISRREGGDPHDVRRQRLYPQRHQ